MDFLIELVIELFFEGCVAGATNWKLPKLFRYFILSLVILFFIIVIAFIFLLGIKLIHEDIIVGGIVLILLSFFILFGSIRKYKRLMKDKKYC